MFLSLHKLNLKDMGWLSFPMHEPVSDWFKKNINSDNYEVVDSALVNRNTLYSAVKNKSTGEIFCAIYLIRWSRSYYNFSYKDMDEFCGPYQYNCPQRIMKLLSPLNDEIDPNGWARNWRKNVEEYWNKRNTLKKNKDSIIKLKDPVSFTSGSQYQYFKKSGRKLVAGVMIDNKFEPYSYVRINLSHFEYELI